MAKENFTEYTEVDAGADITVSANLIEIVTQAVTIESHVTKSKNIQNNFKYNVDVKRKSHVQGNASTMLCGVFGVSRGSNTYTELVGNNDGILIFFQVLAGGTISIKCIEYEVSDNEDSYTYSGTDWRYLTITKKESNLTIDIYSDSARNTKVDTLNIVCHATNNYNTLIAHCTFEGGNGANNFTIDIANLREVKQIEESARIIV